MIEFIIVLFCEFGIAAVIYVGGHYEYKTVVNKDKLLNSYFMRIYKALDKIEFIYNLEYEVDIIDAIKEIERILRGYDDK